MDRTEYLKTARDNAIEMAAAVELAEREAETEEDALELEGKADELHEEAERYQSELTLIDARHAEVGRPDDNDRTRMANLRDRVRRATQDNLSATATIALANEVLGVIEEVRGVSA